MSPAAGKGSPYRDTRLHVLGRKGLKGAVEEKTKYIEIFLSRGVKSCKHITQFSFTRVVYY